MAAAKTPAQRGLAAARLDGIARTADEPAQQRQPKGEQHPEAKAAGEKGPDHGTVPLGLQTGDDRRADVSSSCPLRGIGKHMQRVRMTASGLVQGVFFRASVRDEARRLRLTGWVRNAPDGTVVLEAQGDAQAVAALAAFCRAGPGHARVETLAVETIASVEGESGFCVR